MIYKGFNFLVLIFYNHISKFYCCKDTTKLSNMIISCQENDVFDEILMISVSFITTKIVAFLAKVKLYG